MCFFLRKKHLFLGPKKGYGFGGYPLPPFTDKIFSGEGVTDLGGTPPPPFTDKIHKEVFDVLPNSIHVYIKVISANKTNKLTDVLKNIAFFDYLSIF